MRRLCEAVLVLGAASALAGCGGDRADAPTATATVPGRDLFLSAGCGVCHTLPDAGATGTAGPRLDRPGLTAAGIEAVLRDGKGKMPSYAATLSAPQMRTLARYLARQSGS